MSPPPTGIPPYSADPAAGPVRAAATLGVGSAAARVALHLRVVGLLAAETEVVTEFVTDAGGRPVAAALTGTWTDLVEAVTGQLPADSADAAPVVCRQPGLTATYDGDSVRAEAHPTTFDAVRLDRFLGYLTAAAAALAGGRDEPVLAADLLSPDERDLLLAGLSGPVVPLPEQRVHELVATQAATRPAATAIVHRDTAYSYQWLLDATARIGTGLRGQGVGPGDVVALSAPRGPGWVAAILAIFEAGAVFLPLEADFPPARTETLVARSGARLLVDPVRLAGWLVAEPGPPPPPVPVGATDPAYVYYTSGSTGEPKGALCAHDGMVNHLLAKLADFGLTASDTVLQSAQATFDISLWQAVAPLLVGGRTLILDKDEILDVPAFVAALDRHDVTVAQVVPSYLDILLRHVETAGPESTALATVRCLSVTGEAISLPLVRRLFAARPAITLINAYGATEASDDTTHEIMTAAPEGTSVPVGRPVGNVAVTVVGPAGELVPLGSPGEITFSGVCVGVGYLGDPQRTAEVFGPDPHRPGLRRYRTGDYGRWLPSGSLEFHGRRDEQVKISGIRLELGEVEYRILEVPGVNAAAVVAVPMPGIGKQLAGFYVVGGATELTPPDLARALARTLPAAAIPAVLRPLPALPLNRNGKVDKSALTALLAEPASDEEPAAPATGDPVHDRIVWAWAAALQLPAGRIRAEDDFFALGGSSLRALRVVAALDGLIAIDDLIRHPVLADLVRGAQGPTGSTDTVLRRFGAPVPGPRYAVVVFPPAAGTALAAAPLAAALAGRGEPATVYGVQPPGHDPLSTQALCPLPELVDRAVAEIAALDLPVLLWGHSAGAAAALACAGRLTGQVRHVVLGAPVAPLTAAAHRRRIAGLAVATDDALRERLRAASDLDPADLPAAARARAAATYRHDCLVAEQFLLDAAEAVEHPRIDVGLTVVTAADDPTGPGADPAAWRRWSDHVDVRVLDVGGHPFLRTAPELVADLVLAAAPVRRPVAAG